MSFKKEKEIFYPIVTKYTNNGKHHAEDVHPRNGIA